MTLVQRTTAIQFLRDAEEGMGYISLDYLEDSIAMDPGLHSVQMNPNIMLEVAREEGWRVFYDQEEGFYLAKRKVMFE